jgi:indolepyruvate ferredoxin oxidoreductase, beta subunit
MDKIKNVLMVGVGGQGIITASDILSEAALLDGYDVKKSEIHGMSQRGGSVFSHVRYGQKVYSPTIREGEADVLLSLELVETLRWLSYTNKETKLILSLTKIQPQTVKDYPTGIEDSLKKSFKEHFFIDPKEINQATGDQRMLNTVLLGILSKFVNISNPSWEQAIEKLVPQGTLEVNLKAFQLGKELF